MKKLMLGLALIAAFTVISCKNENTKVENSEEVAVAEYQCPMKCEGDKTYTDKDTKCPVCGMSLKLTESKAEGKEENHDSHDH
jgi:protein SCO1/2